MSEARINEESKSFPILNITLEEQKPEKDKSTEKSGFSFDSDEQNDKVDVTVSLIQESVTNKMRKSIQFTRQEVDKEILTDKNQNCHTLKGITKEVKNYQQLYEMIQVQKEREGKRVGDILKVGADIIKEQAKQSKSNKIGQKTSNLNEPYDISPSDQFRKNLEQDAKDQNWFGEKIELERKKFLGQYFEKQKEIRSNLQFENVNFECEHCKSFGGQFQFETRLVQGSCKQYVIVVKGFDHISKSLMLLIYRYDVTTRQTSFVKKIILCKSLHEECVSMFYASHAQVGNWLYYWNIVEEPEQNIFEFRKLDIEEMEEHILVKQIKCPRDDPRYHIVGLVMNKQFMQFTDQFQGIDESARPKELTYKDYLISLFYSNSMCKQDVKLEIRKYEEFEKISFEGTFTINLKDTMFSTFFKKSLIKTFQNFQMCPERMIVLHCRDFNYNMHYYLFEIKEDDSIEKIEIPPDEESQMILRTQFRDITKELRKEIKYFANYKFQWYYQFHMQRKEGKNVPVQFKSKTKAVFTSVNNIAREFLDIPQPDVKLQKLNLVYDLNENKVFMLLMKTPQELCIFEIDTQMGNRTQIFKNSQMSNFNFQIMEILKHETQLTVNLTYSQIYTNLVRNHKLIYCFSKGQCFKITDINHKCNEYHKNFIYQIDQNWYLQFNRVGIEKYFTPDQAPQNMYCNIADDLGAINSTLFIQYQGKPKWDEYVLEWNTNFRLDDEHFGLCHLPIRVSRNERWKRVRNPLQVIMEQIRIQENSVSSRPFVGIHYQASNPKNVDTLWFGILDTEKKEVTHCHQVDINDQETKCIQSIQISKSSMLDREFDYEQVNSIHKLPDGCKKEYSYQVMVWFGEDNWILKIYEFRVRWWEQSQSILHGSSNITVEQISQKVIVASMDPKEDLRVQQMQFFSLFDNKMNIIGTVLDAKMLQNEDKMKTINLENFKKADYQFQNKFCYFGYKIYNMNYIQTQKFLVVEAKLKESISDLTNFFSEYDKSLILSNQNAATLNHVPFSFQSFLHLDGTIKPEKFNFFQPLQILNGASECTYQLYHPSTVGNKLNLQKAKTNKRFQMDLWFYQSLLDVILNDGDGKQKEILQRFGYTTFMIPDLKNTLTSLHYCFEMSEIQMQSAHILIKEILNTPVQSEFNQVLMTQILSNIYDRKDIQISPQIYNFFITDYTESNRIEDICKISFEKFYDHDLLPRGSDKERQVFDFDPVHISTKCFENSMFDIIMAHERQIIGQTYSVEYSYIDLRPMNFQRKIDQIINQKEGKELVFKCITYRDFQILSEAIAWGSEEKLEQMGGLQKVIDKVFFDQTRGFFLVLNIVYLLGFVAPFLSAEFEIVKDSEGIFLTIASCTMVFFGLIETLDLIENRLAYFTSLWNWFDLALIVVWFIFYFLRMRQGYIKDMIVDLKDEYTDSIILMNILKVIVILLSFLKIISFCRVFEGFASLIMLLKVVLSDLKYFQSFFFLLIALFTLLQQILSIQYPGSGYVDVPSGTALFIQSFQNSIGNISAPNYPLLTNLLKNDPFLAGIQLSLIWFIWFANQYIILVIMLNFLISVIGQTYARVTERSKMHAYRFRNQLNVEYLQIRDKFRQPMKIDCVLLVTSVDDYQVKEENFDNMKKDIIEVIEESRKEAKEQIQNMDGRLQKVEFNVEEIKKMLQSITAQPQGLVASKK